MTNNHNWYSTTWKQIAAFSCNLSSVAWVGLPSANSKPSLMKVSKAIKNVNKANHFKFLAPLLLALSCGVAQAVEQPLDRIAVIVDDGIIMHSQYVQRLAEVKHNLGK